MTQCSISEIFYTCNKVWQSIISYKRKFILYLYRSKHILRVKKYLTPNIPSYIVYRLGLDFILVHPVQPIFSTSYFLSLVPSQLDFYSLFTNKLLLSSFICRWNIFSILFLSFIVEERCFFKTKKICKHWLEGQKVDIRDTVSYAWKITINIMQ